MFFQGEVMNREITESVDEMGLLANGTSARWDIAINDCPVRNEWWIEIESSEIYLTFQLAALSVVHAALAFLRRELSRPSGTNGQQNVSDAPALMLGRFGENSVSLIWDNEDFVRCFLTMSHQGLATFRLSFDGEDVRMLIEALEQVVQDLPTPDATSPSGE
jgi:hypothetical protein